MFRYQLVDGSLAVIAHDFARHHASGIAVAAIAELDMHGDEFLRFFQCHCRPVGYSSNGSSFLGTATFFSVTYFGMPFLYGG